MISDGRKGHEIQSQALAERISHQSQIHQFRLKQPWETFTPRIIPGLESGIIWSERCQPSTKDNPNLIITTGRKAAAVGKLMIQKMRHHHIQTKHIQILNPKDSFKNYDLLLIPAHDQITGENVISFAGSIHPFDRHWYSQCNKPNSIIYDIVLVIGNPTASYFKQQFAKELQKIKASYPDHSLLVCGSPRLNIKHTNRIKKLLSEHDGYWFNEADGKNPYPSILKTSKHLFVTADSINMINECASSQAALTLLAQNQVSLKHQRFITSITERCSEFGQAGLKKQVPLPHPIDEIVENTKLQKLLNSPNSSSSG